MSKYAPIWYLNDQKMNQDFYQFTSTSFEEGGKMLKKLKEINTKEVIYWKAQI
jgi:hypothetical protein